MSKAPSLPWEGLLMALEPEHSWDLCEAGSGPVCHLPVVTKTPL